jgi:hypothetical protein
VEGLREKIEARIDKHESIGYGEDDSIRAEECRDILSLIDSLTRFDDLVIESDGEAWAYVCDSHMDISQYPIVGDAMADGLVCGVYGCHDEAKHIIRITDKKLPSNRWALLEYCMQLNTSSEYAREVMNEKERAMQEIVFVVSEASGISIKQILGTKRKGPVIVARHVAAYLIRTKLKYKFDDIGDYFDRHHSTIIHAVKKVKWFEINDKEYAKLIKSAQRRLDA